jgi:hypothetical protein
MKKIVILGVVLWSLVLWVYLNKKTEVSNIEPIIKKQVEIKTNSWVIQTWWLKTDNYVEKESWNTEENIFNETKINSLDDNNVKWVELTHENFWNNTNYFAHSDYQFANIKFSYPENFEKNVASDTESFSAHEFYEKDSKKGFIIKDHFISWCPELYTRCEEKDMINRTWDEKLKLLVDYYNKENVWTFNKKNYLLKWLRSYSYISNDKLRYIFEIDWDVVEFLFYFENWNNDFDFVNKVMSLIYKDKIN